MRMSSLISSKHPGKDIEACQGAGRCQSKAGGQHGFILVSVTLLMLLIALAALAINRETGLGVRLAANQVSAAQMRSGRQAAIEQARWKLAADPGWRTPAGGEDYAYAGTLYNRKVLNATLACYEDAITVSVTPKGGTEVLRTTYRDGTDVYIADTNNNVIRLVETATGNITTVAGTGIGGFSGDGGPAVNAMLAAPAGIDVASSGDLYIADTNNNRIRRVDAATGIITTVAGNGTVGYSGDGGPAVNAQFNKPKDLRVSPTGDLYIAETNSSAIRRVDAATGIITTVVGNGTIGYSGDGGPAVSAQLGKPQAIFLTATGDLYIADTNNSVIRRVDAATGIITTLAGNGTVGYSGDGGPAVNAGLGKPTGVGLGPSGNIYIGDTLNHLIRRVDAATGIITSVAGTPQIPGFAGDCGPAGAALLNKPSGVFVNPAGDVLIADKGNHRIRRVDGASQSISTLAGNGIGGYAGDGSAAIDAQIQQPENALNWGAAPLFLRLETRLD